MPDKVSSLIFKRSVQGDTGEISLDGSMLNVLMELDGRKSLGSVAGRLDMDFEVLKTIIKNLYQRKLIKKIEPKASFIDEEFLSFLSLHLSRSVGPIAEILVEDEIEDMSVSRSSIPTKRAAEFVELLSGQIPRENKKVQFQKVMIEKIKSKGY